MNNQTIFRLIGMDEEDNALFHCSFCDNIISVENDGTGSIEMARIGDFCPECGARIMRIELD